MDKAVEDVGKKAKGESPEGAVNENSNWIEDDEENEKKKETQPK